jgi:type I restriction enzyme S subunit
VKAATLDKKLGDVVSVQSGFAFKSSEYSDSGHFLIRIANVQDGYLSLEKPKYVALNAKTKRFELSAGDILTSLTGNVGRVAKVEPEHLPAALNQRVARLVPKPDAGIDAQYLLRFLHSSTFSSFLEERAHGAAQANVSPSVISEVPIPLPPLEEQQRIVAVLDEAFEGLARARAHAEANLQNARELFESLRFVMLSEQTEGWETRRLSDCFRLKSGENLTAKNMITGPFSVYGGNGIAGMHHESNLSGDNVIIGRVGALCGNARYIDHDIWLTDNAFKVVNYNFAFDHRFLTYLLNFKNLRSLARQAAQPVISNSSLADLDLTFPLSVDLQAELANKLAVAEMELEDVQKRYEEKLQDLDDLRQSLLQKAFAGELT